MTSVQRQVLHKMQLRPDLLHSKYSLHCRLVTLHALCRYTHAQWCKSVDTGYEIVDYYMITDAEKNAGKDIAL